MIKTMLLASLAAGIAVHAHAYDITAGGTVVPLQGKVSSVPGAVTIDFNSGTLPSGYSGGDVLIGTHPFALPPAGTTTFYYVPVSSPGTVSFGTLVSYFGYLWGSPDDNNNIELLRDGIVIAAFTGTELSNASGIRIGGPGDTSDYLNIFADDPSEYFDQVNFTQGTFETDNHAFLPIPEPATFATLLTGLGLLVLMVRRTDRKSPAHSTRLASQQQTLRLPCAYRSLSPNHSSSRRSLHARQPSGSAHLL